MKKRKKLLISIFSIFAFVLSIFSISNVYAYEQGENENELVNTLNYCNLNNFSLSCTSNYSYTIIDDYTINLKSSNALNSSNKYFEFSFSNLDNDRYFVVVINNINYYQNYNNDSSNYIQWSFLRENNSSVFVANSWYSSNLQQFQINKSNTNYRLRISNVLYDTNRFLNKDITYKIYMYKYNDTIDNSSDLYIKNSLYDFMLSSDSDYIDIDLYNSLLEQYNQLNSGFNDLGFLYYLDYWNSYFTTDDMYNISDYINGSRLNLYELANYNNSNYSRNMVSFIFNTSNRKLLIGNLNFIFSGGANCEVRIVNQDGDWFVFQATNNLVVNQDYIISNDTNNYLWESIEEIHFICNSPDDVNGLNFNVEYTIGFNDGYNNGYTYGYTSGYNSGLSSNNSYYHQLYDELVVQYNDLQELYNDYINGNVSFNTLIWNIATIPFESFKQIWNVDLLGLNIGNFVTALMFVGVVVYIWKKFL